MLGVMLLTLLAVLLDGFELKGEVVPELDFACSLLDVVGILLE